jgi:tetratricopeptide (TPR) repeat protein
MNADERGLTKKDLSAFIRVHQRLIFLLFLASAAFAQQRPPAGQLDTRDLVRKPASFVTNTQTGQPMVATGYALIIGIGHFKDSQINALTYPESDAQEMFRVLISPQAGYIPQNVHKLIGEDATLAKLKYELEQWLPNVAGEQDRVLIYFAGHGFVEQGKGYLALYDTRIDNLTGTAYPMPTLGKVTGTTIRSKWKALITDACHSGNIQQVNQSLDDVGSGSNLFTFSASRGDERSFEDPTLGGGHGVFTYFVVQGLQGQADESGDGVVTAEELAYYVTHQVHAYVVKRTKNQESQNPNSGKNEYDGGMILASDVSKLKTDSAMGMKEGRIVVQSNMDDVEIRLNGMSKGVAGKGKELELPGLLPGDYTIVGARRGYEPDGPKTIQVRPGETTTVPINIRVRKNVDKKAEDLFNQGFGIYQKKGNIDGYKQAASDFDRALKIDGKYSEAADYAGRAYRMADQLDESAKDFQKALKIDPDYTVARIEYAGMLLDRGDTDESIRQLSEAVQREPRNALAFQHMAEAYRLAGDYEQCVGSARTSVKLDPKIGASHLFLGDCLRLSGQLTLAKDSYQRSIKLSNFDPGVSGQLNYWVIGSLIGLGSKRAASRRDVNKDIRNLSYLGLCSCEVEAKRPDAAIPDCQQALHFDPKDPYSYFLLGVSYLVKYNAVHSGEKELLLTAQTNFNKMLALNGDIEEAGTARGYLQKIETALKRVH